MKFRHWFCGFSIPEVLVASTLCNLRALTNRAVGGFSPGPNSTAVPDWVDSTVAGWIEAESAAMNEAWGPATNRGALAFVHIPPYVFALLIGIIG